MTGHERASEWRRFAEGDLKSARVLLKEELFNEVCFHSQQCIEKLLKSILVQHGKQVPKTHRLVDLLEEVLRKGNRWESLRDRCAILDQYYIPSRYPDAVIGSKPTGLPSLQDAREALEIAEAIWSAIAKGR